MKPLDESDAYWTARLAPYFLLSSAIGLILSVVWIIPAIWYFALGSLSGAAVSWCHLLKWRTGREAFQFGAMACGLGPVMYVAPRVETLQAAQYLAVFVLVYSGGVMAFRNRNLSCHPS